MQTFSKSSSDVLLSAPKQPPIASMVMINETEYDVTGCCSLKALTALATDNKHSKNPRKQAPSSDLTRTKQF